MERGIPLVGSLSVSQLNSLFSRTLPSSTKALKLNTGNLKVHQRAGKREFNKREEKSSAITGTGVWGPLHHGSVTTHCGAVIETGWFARWIDEFQFHGNIVQYFSLSRKFFCIVDAKPSDHCHTADYSVQSWICGSNTCGQWS